TISDVRIGIENKIAHTRRAARIEGLLKAARIERVSNRLGPNHRDRLSPIVARRKNRGCLAGRRDCWFDRLLGHLYSCWLAIIGTVIQMVTCPIPADIAAHTPRTIACSTMIACPSCTRMSL